MAVWSKFMEYVPNGNAKAVIAVVTLGAGLGFYINRRMVDARLVETLSLRNSV